jgi:hypothetical protein
MNLIEENIEQMVIAHDSLLDMKVADSMIETIHEMRATTDNYNTEFNKEPKLKSIANDPLHFQAFHMVIDKVRERMKERKLKQQGFDFMKKNKILTKYWNQYEFERRQKHQDSLTANLQTVQKKRDFNLKCKREK